MSEKQKILSGLLRADLGPGNNDFRLLLSGLAQQQLSKDKIDADRFADRNLTKYWNWCKAMIDEHRNRSLHPYFIVPSSQAFAISCASRELGMCSSEQSQHLGPYLRTRAAILRQIDSLDDRAFEALAGITCLAVGSSDFFLTPPGNEGGIDFFANIVVPQIPNSFSRLAGTFRVIGQCKKYASPLAVDKFEQFLHTMQNVRHRSSRVRKQVPKWFDNSNAPIIGWMISHQGFQTGAADEAKQHGVVCSDSLDIAEILSQSKLLDVSTSLSLQKDVLAKKCQDMLAMP